MSRPDATPPGEAEGTGEGPPGLPEVPAAAMDIDPPADLPSGSAQDRDEARRPLTLALSQRAPLGAADVGGAASEHERPSPAPEAAASPPTLARGSTGPAPAWPPQPPLAYSSPGLPGPPFSAGGAVSQRFFPTGAGGEDALRELSGSVEEGRPGLQVSAAHQSPNTLPLPSLPGAASGRPSPAIPFPRLGPGVASPTAPFPASGVPSPTAPFPAPGGARGTAASTAPPGFSSPPRTEVVTLSDRRVRVPTDGDPHEASLYALERAWVRNDPSIPLRVGDPPGYAVASPRHPPPPPFVEPSWVPKDPDADAPEAWPWPPPPARGVEGGATAGGRGGPEYGASGGEGDDASAGQASGSGRGRGFESGLDGAGSAPALAAAAGNGAPGGPSVGDGGVPGRAGVDEDAEAGAREDGGAPETAGTGSAQPADRATGAAPPYDSPGGDAVRGAPAPPRPHPPPVDELMARHLTRWKALRRALREHAAARAAPHAASLARKIATASAERRRGGADGGDGA